MGVVSTTISTVGGDVAFVEDGCGEVGVVVAGGVLFDCIDFDCIDFDDIDFKAASFGDVVDAETTLVALLARSLVIFSLSLSVEKREATLGKFSRRFSMIWEDFL